MSLKPRDFEFQIRVITGYAIAVAVIGPLLYAVFHQWPARSDFRFALFAWSGSIFFLSLPWWIGLMANRGVRRKSTSDALPPRSKME